MTWRNEAACRDTDPSAFFASGTTPAEVRALCAGCPVLAECRADTDAMEPSPWEVHGYRGGERPGERIARRWGRPARNPMISYDVDTPCTECGALFRGRAGMLMHRTKTHQPQAVSA